MTEAGIMDFDALVSAIRQVHDRLVAQVGKAVNISLTLRNWLIGCYLAEYELQGLDRASYGEKLLLELANHLTSKSVSNCNRRQLYDYLKFYRTYPDIAQTVSAQLQTLLPERIQEDVLKVPTAPAQLELPVEKLINSLSYSHFKHLTELNDNLKRAFYEIECIRGNWSVRELRRQMGSLYRTFPT